MSQYTLEHGFGPGPLWPEDKVEYNSAAHTVRALLPQRGRKDVMPYNWALYMKNSPMNERTKAAARDMMLSMPLFPVQINTPYLFLVINGSSEGDPPVHSPASMNVIAVLECYLFTRRELCSDPGNPHSLKSGNALLNFDTYYRQVVEEFEKIIREDEELMAYANFLADSYRNSGQVVGNDDTAVLERFAKLFMTCQHNILKLFESFIYTMIGFTDPLSKQNFFGTQSDLGRAEYYNSAALPCLTNPNTPGGVDQLASSYLREKAIAFGLDYILPEADINSTQVPFDLQYLRLLIVVSLFTSEHIKKV